MQKCKYCDREIFEGEVCDVCAAKLDAVSTRSPQSLYFRREDIRKNIAAACFSYIPFVFLFLLKRSKQSDYLKYHIVRAMYMNVIALSFAVIGIAAHLIFPLFLSDLVAVGARNIAISAMMVVWAALFGICSHKALTGLPFRFLFAKVNKNN